MSQARTAGGERPTVLIVDDQVVNIQALAAILGKDVRSVFALNGEQALVRAREMPIDLVLLDVLLPGLDGFTVCSRLKADPETRTIPVIFVSGLTEGADEERGFAVGAVDYIHKPFLPAIVQARVRTHLKLKAALEQLDRLSRTDQLTGIANRRGFDERLTQACEKSARLGQPLSLLLLDLDHFKQVNDRHGHAVGDLVLVEVARVLAERLEATEVLSRWGGEEFAVLAVRDLENAVALADALRQAIARGPLCGLQVTVSIGIAEFDPRLSVLSWFQRADQALYLAKQRGRNRCEVA